jgi:CBS domain-containing protein
MTGHARSIMTVRVTSVAPGTPLAEIARLLVAGGFGGVPVVGRDGRLEGFVSETDLVNALLESRGPDTQAVDVMSTPVIAVDEFDTTEEVMRLLREHAIHHLPVVREGRLVGIITPSDVIRFLVERTLPVPPEVG